MAARSDNARYYLQMKGYFRFFLFCMAAILRGSVAVAKTLYMILGDTILRIRLFRMVHETIRCLTELCPCLQNCRQYP